MKPLPQKPFYSSIAVIVLLPLLTVLLNFSLLMFLGIKTFDENRIDKIFHICGGISIYFSTAGVLWHLLRRKIIDLQDKHLFRALAFGVVCFAIIVWEILEYIVPGLAGYMTYADTITDMICGLIGGVFAMLFFRKPDLGKNFS